MTEIHANEILLLAYYIATTNIENAYQQITGQEYRQFEGICLADTFTLADTLKKEPPLLEGALKENNERLANQRRLKPIQVIIGNPPYSVGQKNVNQNNRNVAYPELDDDIRQHYGESRAALIRNLYDGYIRAIRWASNRIGEQGIIGFVTNSGWLDGKAMDGMRACLAQEFNDIYVLNLRGNIRKNMFSKGQAQEGDNIFGQKSMAGNAITLFVKNPSSSHRGVIHYRDIGDGLRKDEKLKFLKDCASMKHIDWQSIKPNEHHDWLNQRDHTFERYIAIGDKKNREAMSLFANYSLGLATNRDPWCYNASKGGLAKNMHRMIEFYNNEMERYKLHGDSKNSVSNFVDNDLKKIKWTRGLHNHVAKGRKAAYDVERLYPIFVSSVYQAMALLQPYVQ